MFNISETCKIPVYLSVQICRKNFDALSASFGTSWFKFFVPILKSYSICKENLKIGQIRVSLTNAKNLKSLVKSHVHSGHEGSIIKETNKVWNLPSLNT